MCLKSINPFDFSTNKIVQEDNEALVLDKLQCAEVAFEQWKHTSFESRSRLMKAAATQLKLRKEELARLITIEMGKPIKEALAEVEKCANTCLFYAERAEGFLKQEIIATLDGNQAVVYFPLGAILAVMPWNFPFWQVIRFAAPALMAGNVAVLKHASNVPLCSLALEEVFINSGFPIGVFQSLLVGANKMEQVIAHTAIKAVTLTGSEKAGSKVASLAGKYIKKSVLELGGNDAFIVLPDAPLEVAAAMAIKSRMINTGQSCIAAKRIIVVAPVYEQFIKLLHGLILKLKVGNPLEPNTDIGPIARGDLLDSILLQVKQTKDQGAKVVCGGNRINQVGAFMEPTLLCDVMPGMTAFEEEVFGPVVSVVKAKDEKEAIYLANLSQYGLGASIWTHDINKAQTIAHQLEVGFVAINRIVASDPNLPFGGIKKSGFGRELSYHGIREFTNIKTIILQS